MYVYLFSQSDDFRVKVYFEFQMIIQITAGFTKENTSRNGHVRLLNLNWKEEGVVVKIKER